MHSGNLLQDRYGEKSLIDTAYYKLSLMDHISAYLPSNSQSMWQKWNERHSLLEKEKQEKEKKTQDEEDVQWK